MVHGDIGLRHRAALSHLAAFPLVTSIWVPLLLRRYDPEDELLYYHSTGAALYQGLTLVAMTVLWLCRKVPYAFLDDVRGNLLLALLGSVALCALGVYFLGAVYLALSAWHGEPFWAPGVAWLMGYEPSKE